MSSPQLLVELTSRMGLALIRVQKAEEVLKICLTHFLPGQTGALESLEAREEGNRKKMLGQLLAKLKKRLDFDPKFENVLADFLADRNTFVHNLFGVPGFSLSTDEELKVGMEFVLLIAKSTARYARCPAAYHR